MDAAQERSGQNGDARRVALIPGSGRLWHRFSEFFTNLRNG